MTDHGVHTTSSGWCDRPYYNIELLRSMRRYHREGGLRELLFSTSNSAVGPTEQPAPMLGNNLTAFNAKAHTLDQVITSGLRD